MSFASEFNEAWEANLRGGRENFSDWLGQFDFEIVQNEVVDQWRWGIINEAIYRRKPDFSGVWYYIKVRWYDVTSEVELGLDEMRVTAIDVRPHVVKTTVYLP